MNEENKKHVLIDVPMPIVTPRLILRPWQAGDGAVLTDAKAETWEALCRWMLWTNGGQDAQRDEIHARERQAAFILRTDMSLIGFEKDTGLAVIWTGLHQPDWEKRHFSTGYWVRQSAQGKGYATESTNALLRYAFNALAAQRVEICHAEGNDASRRVIEKLGFVKEGVLVKAHQLPDGSMVDEHAYARLDANGLSPLSVTWGLP